MGENGLGRWSCPDEDLGHSTTPETTQDLCMTGRGSAESGERGEGEDRKEGEASNALQKL